MSKLGYTVITLPLWVTALGLSSVLIMQGCGSSSNKSPVAMSATAASASPSDVKKYLPDTVGKGKPVIVDFNSKFCLACQQLKPKLEKVSASAPGVTVLTFDIQHYTPEQKALADAYHVNTVPYVVFVNGEGKTTKTLLEDAPQSDIDTTAKALLSKAS